MFSQVVCCRGAKKHLVVGKGSMYLVLFFLHRALVAKSVFKSFPLVETVGASTADDLRKLHDKIGIDPCFMFIFRRVPYSCMDLLEDVLCIFAVCLWKW